jgi:hypothetical protein
MLVRSQVKSVLEQGGQYSSRLLISTHDVTVNILTELPIKRTERRHSWNTCSEMTHDAITVCCRFQATPWAGAGNR